MSSPQKVVIPKGLVNPNETTIVEIPKQLQNVGTVVARPRPHAYKPGTPSLPRAPPKPTYHRRTHPPKSRPVARHMYDRGETYAGTQFEESVLPSPRMYQPWYPKSPRDAYTPEISIASDLSYRPGVRRKNTFDPTLGSSPQDLDYSEGSLYRDFRPGYCSPRVGSPGLYPGSLKDYVSSGDEKGRYYKSHITKSTPEEQSEEITEERSYYEDEDQEGEAEEEEEEDACPCAGSYRGDYSSEYSSSPTSPGGRAMTQADMMNSLGELESNELNKIMGDLNTFQSARRKLVFDASSLASAADVSSSILNSS